MAIYRKELDRRKIRVIEQLHESRRPVQIKEEKEEEEEAGERGQGGKGLSIDAQEPCIYWVEIYSIRGLELQS